MDVCIDAPIFFYIYIYKKLVRQRQEIDLEEPREKSTGDRELCRIFPRYLREKNYFGSKPYILI